MMNITTFDMDTMGTIAFPLSTPLAELWENTLDNDELKKTDSFRLTQMVVDYLQRESIEAFMVNLPCVLIAGKPCLVRPRKLMAAYMPENDDELLENLGFDMARIIRNHAEDGKSVGIMYVGCTPIANPVDADENYIQRVGIIVRYLLSDVSVQEVLRLAELTDKHLEEYAV